MVVIRQAVVEDYYKHHVDLYKQLSNTIDKLSFEEYSYLIEPQSTNHAIFVIEHNNKIVGAITVLIEQKIIHNFGKVAHIEDVIVHKDYRNNKYGKELIEFAIHYAKQQKCYKIILDCKDEYCSFYEQNGFTKMGNMMAIYF